MVTAPPAVAGVADLLERARADLDRVTPADLPRLLAQGAVVVDLRGPSTRLTEGHIPGAWVIDRLVLEWRLCPTSSAQVADGPGLEDRVVLVCNEGYASSLAAADLQRLGFVAATDLIGGFRAYRDAGLPIAALPTREYPSLAAHA